MIQITPKPKTCTICDYDFFVGNKERQHKFYRNYGGNENSSRMESAATAEDFLKIIVKAGLIHKYLIYDGDS